MPTGTPRSTTSSTPTRWGDEPGRTTLGAEQYEWFTEGLAASTAAWRVIGNPYNINPWRLVNLEFLRAFRPDLPPNSGIYAPNEAWDDYMAERRDLLQFLVDAGVTDTVFASGHTHVPLVASCGPTSTVRRRRSQRSTSAPGR